VKPRAHNVLSYAGALVVFSGVAFARSPAPAAALLPLALWTAHFARRVLESALLHRYGKPRVPTGDALQEYAYYWGFAVWIAYAVTRSGYAPSSGTLLWAGIATYAAGEIGNFATHVMLARLRPPGTTVRAIPRGFVFELVSCPNYLFEILAWLGFALVVRVAAAWAFLALGAAILADWARKRHAAYRAEFPDYPRRRTRLIPFVY
jgi:very-long-chain enoyl-CoA reductase